MHPRTSLPLALLAAMALSAAACAQPASPPGASASGPRVGGDFTPGWSMMSPQERDAFHQRMRDAKNRQECEQMMTEHRQLMQERAKQRGMPMHGPRSDACERMRG